MSKRNQVQFSRPDDPKFLKLIKEQIGYKDEPSVDTKRQKLNQQFDNSSDSDEEKPQIVVTKIGDLTADQVEVEKRRIEIENQTKPADLSQRIIFKSKAVKSKPDKSETNGASDTLPDKIAKRKDISKSNIKTSTLSFALEDDIDDNYNSGELLI